MKKPGRPRGVTKAVISFRRALEHSLAETEKRAPFRQSSPSEKPTNASCGSKKYCREMSSCEEAKFYLRECGLTRLDGDKDGVPCESICK